MSAGQSPLLLAILATLAAFAVALLPTPLAILVVVAIVILTALFARDRDRDVPGSVAPPSTVVDDLTRMIEPLDEGVVALDADFNVVATNRAAAYCVGRPLDTMVGVSLIQAVRDHDLAEVARGIAGAPVAVHLSTAGHDVLATAVAFGAPPVETLLMITDVTELTLARRARSELVANVSHELRTPIAAARALAETLQAGVDEVAERERFLNRLVEELERLGNIVQRLLRLARIESGQEPFDEQAQDARALLEDAAARLAPVAEQQGVRLEVEAAPDSGAVVADRERVLEVLSNLVDNAVRHSPAGEAVTLRATRADEFVCFEVSDHGPGIPLHDRERVFERFYTGDRSREARGGSGLGLAIARHIVQRLGGRIWIADGATHGATMCFTLRAASEAASEPGEQLG